MIYALWVIHRNFIEKNPEDIETISEAFIKAKEYGFGNIPALVDRAREKTCLSRRVLKKYFSTIRYSFDSEERKALLTFYDYAYKSGLINERVKLNIWGEEID